MKKVSHLKTFLKQCVHRKSYSMTSGGDNFSYYYDDNVSNHSEENENDQERYYSKIIGKHGLKFGVQSKK